MGADGDKGNKGQRRERRSGESSTPPQTDTVCHFALGFFRALVEGLIPLLVAGSFFFPRFFAGGLFELMARSALAGSLRRDAMD